MMNDDEEDLDNFQAENKENLAESLVGAYRAESTGQLTAGNGITTKIPPLFDGLTSWFRYKSWSTTGWILQGLKQKNEVQHWRTDLSETQKCTRDFLTVNILKAADGVKYFRDTLRHHFIKLENLSIHPSEKRKRRHGQVGRQVLSALDTLKGFLDGHVADVHPGRRTKTKPVSCRRRSGECEYKKKCGTFGSERTSDPRMAELYTGEQPRKAFSNSVITWQHWCSLSQVIWVNLRERTHKFPISSVNECLRLHFWICKNSVCGIVLYAE